MRGGVLPVALLCSALGLALGWVAAWVWVTGAGGALPVHLRRPVGIITAVVSSWLVAIAALTALLQFLPVTPGYLPDHVE